MIEHCTISDSESEYEGEVDEEQNPSEGEYLTSPTKGKRKGKGKGKGKEDNPETLSRVGKEAKKKRPLTLKKKAEMEMISDEDEVLHPDVDRLTVSIDKIKFSVLA